MITSPKIPLTARISPAFTLAVISFDPTIAGISRDRAMIAEWEVRPPISVTKALTKLRSNCAVSLGVKSWATITTSSLIIEGFGNVTFSKCAKIRFATSLMSAARSCMYALSSIASNMPIYMSVTSFNAASALTLLSAMFCLICPIISGSDRTIKWASNTCASASPKDCAALSRICCNSAVDFARASSKRASSAAVSSTFTFEKDKSGCTNR